MKRFLGRGGNNATRVRNERKKERQKERTKERKRERERQERNMKKVRKWERKKVRNKRKKKASGDRAKDDKLGHTQIILKLLCNNNMWSHLLTKAVRGLFSIYHIFFNKWINLQNNSEMTVMTHSSKSYSKENQAWTRFSMQRGVWKTEKKLCVWVYVREI